MGRGLIRAPLATGVRVLDTMLTFGRGQRVALMSGSGVGKSTLMGMIARGSSADVNVIALIGERGREVREFIEDVLGPDGLRRSVIVVVTSDASPVLQVRGAFAAACIADWFRDQGKDVLFFMDSATRLAMAQRQIGLAAGEPPTTKGYPPSVFSLMPQLLERAGRTERGSITGLYTVLVEGDDMNEPISDAARGFLDGHVWLSRSLANRGHYPAVSVLESISRVMSDVVDDSHAAAARTVRRLMAVWADIEDMVNIGAYTPGANAEYDLVIRMKPKIDTFLQQAVTEPSDFVRTREALIALAHEAQARPAPARKERAVAGAA
jgi:flagellum-specific ATP synthase